MERARMRTTSGTIWTWVPLPRRLGWMPAGLQLRWLLHRSAEDVMHVVARGDATAAIDRPG